MAWRLMAVNSLMTTQGCNGLQMLTVDRHFASTRPKMPLMQYLCAYYIYIINTHERIL